MKWLAIINPNANHHSREALERLSEDLHRYVGADCRWTAYPKQATEIARRHQDYDGFIAVGGDGTVEDVVNGMAVDRHVLGIIPAGTGNGLARDLQIHSEEEAVRILCRERFHPLDLVEVRFRQGNSQRHLRRMISVSGLGYTEGTTTIGIRHSRRLGFWFYVLTAIAQSFRQRKFLARIRFDDGPWQQLSLKNLVVQNTQNVGHFRLFPEARLDDGKFNVLYGQLGPGRQLVEDLAIVSQTYFCQCSERRQVEKLEVELPQPRALMIDGELYDGVDAVTYDVAKRKLWCCIPKPTGSLVTRADDADRSGRTWTESRFLPESR
jgi:diacylglycerol kinase family enzyme